MAVHNEKELTERHKASCLMVSNRVFTYEISEEVAEEDEAKKKCSAS